MVEQDSIEHLNHDKLNAMSIPEVMTVYCFFKELHDLEAKEICNELYNYIVQRIEKEILK